VNVLFSLLSANPDTYPKTPLIGKQRSKLNRRALPRRFNITLQGVECSFEQVLKKSFGGIRFSNESIIEGKKNQILYVLSKPLKASRVMELFNTRFEVEIGHISILVLDDKTTSSGLATC
jgi:hypothetical protein